MLAVLRYQSVDVMKLAAQQAGVKLEGLDANDRETQLVCLESWSMIDGFGDKCMGVRTVSERPRIAATSPTVTRIARWLAE